MDKAALYLRSSKDRHDVSVESQRRELRQAALQAGDIVIAEFEDKVESAKTANRPAFQEMFAEVRSKSCRFDKVYCYDTSRFSRRQYDAQLYKHELRKAGVELVILKLPKTDPMIDKILEGLMEIFDEFHSTKSKMDGLRGMRQNVEDGWRAGGRAPKGYLLEHTVVGMRDGIPIRKSKLVPDPNNFTVVQSYLQGRAKGQPRNELSTALKLDVDPGTLVHIEEIAMTYAGHTVWNRTNERIDGEYDGGKRLRDKSEWVIKRDTHKAMISDEEADLITTQLESKRGKKKRYRKSLYLLSGVIMCSCGAAYDGDSGYYRCHDRCGSPSYKREVLEEKVLTLLRDEILTEENFFRLREKARQMIASMPDGAKRRERELAKRIKKVKSEIQQLIETLKKVNYQETILAEIDRLEEERLTLSEQYESASADSAIPIAAMSDALLRDFLVEYHSLFETDEADSSKKALIRQLVAEAIIKEDSITIHPTLPQLGAGVKLASPRGRSTSTNFPPLDRIY